ncbi:MAG: alpha-L-fucosidase, partial [Verrucomicrobiae bacterium]|nr:alpha-L-fucosidase [Verrucomicrobiae bacterium]NNJ86612.1 alpha-L-fucosidase [Akkermansiaceae bacterium]
SYTEGLGIKPTSEVLHSLIDIVSKNGCMLLNISPKADGTIPEDQRKVLLDIGRWLKVNGEAIYDTRPWTRFGEGPTRLKKGGHFIKEVTYSAKDIRYTRSKDDLTLFAITLGVPISESTIILRSVHSRVKNVTLLGSDQKLEWQPSKEGLQITMPKQTPNDMALVFRIKKSFE